VGLPTGPDRLEGRSNEFGQCGPPSFTLCMTLAILIFNSYNIIMTLPLPMAARSKAWVCGRSNAGMAGLNPAGRVELCSCECCVVSG
jgi:hypothetical protein